MEKRDEVDWKAVGFEAAAGFATDTAKQILVEGKELQKVDFGQAVKTSAVAGATGMLGAVIGIFGESAKEALKKAKEPPKFGAAGGLRAETRGKPKGGYTTYSYDAAWVDRSGNSHSYRVRNADYVIIRAKEYYTDFGGNTRYVSGGVYRRPAADYPNLRSSRGSYAYIGKYVEVDYVGENPWEKTAGYYSSWKNAGNGAAEKQVRRGKITSDSSSRYIYRAVSPEELDDIFLMEGFRERPDGRSFLAKEFGNSFEETLEFANQSINIDKAAIVRVTIPEEIYNRLHHMNLDRKIFRSGTPVVEPDMLEMFNKSIILIEHFY